MKQSGMHGSKRFIRPVTYGLGIGVLVNFLLLALMAGTMSIRDIPQSFISLLSILSFVVAGFAAGYFGAIFSKERGLLVGLFCGACLFVLLLIAGLAAGKMDGFGVQGFTKLAAILFASALGGILGVNKRKKFK